MDSNVATLHMTHVRELSGNFVMTCQGIVMEFSHDINFRLKHPSNEKGSTWVVFIEMFLWQI